MRVLNSDSKGIPGRERSSLRLWPIVEHGWRPEKAYTRLILVPLLFLGLFFVWPLIGMILRSFLEPAFGLGNYERIVDGGPYLRVLWNTISVAFVVTIACLVIAYPSSAAISNLSPSRANLFTGLLMIPLWISVIIRSYAWMVFFQRNGILNQALINLDVIEVPLKVLQTPTAVYIAMVHILLPYMMLPMISNMRSMDRTLLQAGEVLGAAPAMRFLKIYLPLSLPGVGAGMSIVFITALGYYITPSLLGGTSTVMMSQLIEQQASSFLDWPLASALATTLLGMIVTLYMTFNWLSNLGKRS